MRAHGSEGDAGILRYFRQQVLLLRTSMGLTSIWAKLALTPQDYTRWPLTARENIHLGTPRLEGDQAVMEAARASGADTVLAALPQGLDTSLARSWWGGHDLSGPASSSPTASPQPASPTA
ncbi:hypothetical protein [Streptomyces diastaticus]|uniref:hypothetical protein n=1 Tax=Streptomyces diastaticus TaxID=1956 RepID=UPI00340AC36B